MAKIKKGVGTPIVPFFSSRTKSARHSTAQHKRFEEIRNIFSSILERRRVNTTASDEEFFQAVIGAMVEDHGVACVLHALASDVFDRAEGQVNRGVDTERDQYDLSSVLALAHRINALACEVDADNAKRDMEE